VLRRYAPWLVLTLAVGVLAITRPSVADDPPVKEKTKSKTESKTESKTDADTGSKHATVKVEKGPLTEAVTLKGVVQGVEAAELAIQFKSWTGQLVVLKAVEHGTPVKAGAILVEFETEKLDQAIRDARQERELTDLAILQAEVELPLLERQNPLDLAAAERTNVEASADLKQFLAVDRPLAEEAAHFMLKSANFYLSSAKDELKQLQKMYRDKDLTEETEQIILKRYQQRVEMAEFYVKEAKIDHEHTLKVALPRREQTAKEAVARAELALAKARDTNPLTIQQKRLSLAKLRFEQVRAKEKLAELEADRAALIVKAPTDGLAYHGRYVHGQWMVPSGSQGHALLHGGHINPGDVFFTIIAPGKLVVRAEAEEKELPGLTPGLAGRLTPTAFPDDKRDARLARVAKAPLSGKFEVMIELEGKAGGLVPGMTCSVRFVTARKLGALTVPASAVFEDVAEDTHYIYKQAGSGKPEKKTVKVGRTVGERTEIVDGLAEGDEILASKP
jgi:multidrug efflux pump subunit AcrA (membrane-fusion protein)